MRLIQSGDFDLMRSALTRDDHALIKIAE